MTNFNSKIAATFAADFEIIKNYNGEEYALSAIEACIDGLENIYSGMQKFEAFIACAECDKDLSEEDQMLFKSLGRLYFAMDTGLFDALEDMGYDEFEKIRECE